MAEETEDGGFGDVPELKHLVSGAVAGEPEAGAVCTVPAPPQFSAVMGTLFHSPNRNQVGGHVYK